MQITLLWTGREYYSLERCEVTFGSDENQIKSIIVGSYEGKIYQVDYQITTNASWHTIAAVVKCRFNGITQDIKLESDGNGNWTRNQEPAYEFEGCNYVDIALSPFTNTLPIRRLQLKPGEFQLIKVIYFDLLERELKPLTQKYTCISETDYKYENVPNDFEAIIKVDEYGLVVDYPELFVRTATWKAEG